MSEETAAGSSAIIAVGSHGDGLPQPLIHVRQPTAGLLTSLAEQGWKDVHFARETLTYTRLTVQQAMKEKP